MTIELGANRLKLEQMREQLLEELKFVIAENKEETQSFPSASRTKEETVDATTDLERRMALEDRKLNNLADIERALLKIDAGTYGICDICGKPIAMARLAVLPHATYCMKCSSQKTIKGITKLNIAQPLASEINKI